MKLRTATYFTKASPEEIKEFRSRNGVPLREAKRVLTNEVTQLEYYENGTWTKVPHIHIKR